MDNNIIKMTDKQIQDKSAEILKEKQERQAINLKLDQKWDAEILSDDHACHPEENVQQIQEQAAATLQKAHEDAAHALKKSQQEDAALLQNANTRFLKKIKEKNQTIHQLMGGYSVQDDDEQ